MIGYIQLAGTIELLRENFRPPLTPEKKAEIEAKKAARIMIMIMMMIMIMIMIMNNDKTVGALLRQLAGPLNRH